MIRWISQKLVVACIFLFVFHQTGAAQEASGSSDGSKIIVESFVISGTQSLDSAALSEITSSMVGSKFDDDEEELQERVRTKFQDRGYFKAEVQSFDIKVIDPLASPKPVRIEAQVTEGPLCHLSRILITGYRGVSPDELVAKFPIKVGDNINRSKIAAGLVAMRKLYNELGYLDSVFIPDTVFDSSAGVSLIIKVREGPQYRMGKLEILGAPEIAGKLQAQWELQPGAVFNWEYVATFLDKNKSLIPADVSQFSGVQLFKDCSDATVSVHLHLTRDLQHEIADRGKHVDCPRPKDDD